VQKSAGIILASIFWDQDGILLIDYLPKDQTINAEYYLYLLVQLVDILKEKRSGKFTKGVLFLHDNVAEIWLDGQHSEFFLSGLQKLEQQTKKCIELRGEYVE